MTGRESDTPASGAPEAAPGRRSILAVDDEAENLSLVTRLFRLDYDVHTASSAPQAIAILEKHSIDLVLCDQRMPGRSGVDLLEEVSERWPGVARILVTAYADLDSAIDAINKGKVRRYIRKPWDNEDLAAVVAREIEFNMLRDENEKLVQDLEQRNKELLRANSELESLERMKSNLIASVTHELKTPLLSIQGYADMLLAGRAGDLPQRAGKYIDGIMRGAKRLEDLVANLLTGARMEFDGGDLVLSDVDVVARARAVMKTLLPNAEKKGVSIEVRSAGPVLVTADAQAIDRILANLMSNAVKFNVPGGRVTVEAGLRDDEVLISVADNGVGIPSEFLDKIFERFYKIEDPSTPRYGGTGLGLSIVKECVEKHGGRIEARSEPGKGSIFEVVLPAAGYLTDESTEAMQTLPGFGKLVVIGGSPADYLSASRAALLSRGFAVMATQDPAQALAWANRHHPDVLVLDAGLAFAPDRRMPPGIPWVAALSDRDESAVKAALRSGAAGCLLKPIRAAELSDLLDELDAGRPA